MCTLQYHLGHSASDSTHITKAHNEGICLVDEKELLSEFPPFSHCQQGKETA